MCLSHILGLFAANATEATACSRRIRQRNGSQLPKSLFQDRDLAASASTILLIRHCWVIDSSVLVSQ